MPRRPSTQRGLVDNMWSRIPSLAGDGPQFSNLRNMAAHYAGGIDAMFEGPVVLGDKCL